MPEINNLQPKKGHLGGIFSKEGSNLDLDRDEYFSISMQFEGVAVVVGIQRAQSFPTAWEE